MKFKNLRRPERAERAGVSTPDIPPLKKRKVDLTEPSPSDMDEYERHRK